MTFTTGEEHDPAILAAARKLICRSDNEQLVERVWDLVQKNHFWRGGQCVNLIAAESPTSPLVRSLLATEVGTRASGGHIGTMSRCFPGMRYIDQIEALCVELLKDLFGASFADQRLMGGMAGCGVAYAALVQPGSLMMSLSLSAGGDSAGRPDGPAGVRGLRIADIPFDPVELNVDLEAFRREAERLRPALVSINQTTALFPLPVRAMKQIIAPWGGRLYFDAAHPAGLIAGRCYPDPLAEGADVVTGSGGKTFSGPQSGIILWNDENLSGRIIEAIFPILTGSHQLNRVAALAVAAAEMREFGASYMSQVVANARALAAALHDRGFTVVAAHRGFTQTHQILVDVRRYGGGPAVGQALERANIMVNKMLLPSAVESVNPVSHGIRLGTVEVTRLGMGTEEMSAIADLIYRVVVRAEDPDRILKEVWELRAPYQNLHYCFGAAADPSQAHAHSSFASKAAL
jgi:glycine hydroxymethyltransferase